MEDQPLLRELCWLRRTIFPPLIKVNGFFKWFFQVVFKWNRIGEDGIAVARVVNSIGSGGQDRTADLGVMNARLPVDSIPSNLVTDDFITGCGRRE